MKISFKRNKDGSVSVHFDKLSQGGALALCNALNAHAKAGSQVGDDLRAILHNQIQGSNSLTHRDEDQELFAASDGPSTHTGERAAVKAVRLLPSRGGLSIPCCGTTNDSLCSVAGLLAMNGCVS